MPATLYRLASKPHYTEVAVTPAPPPEEVLPPRIEEVAAAVVESEPQIQETQAPQVDVADNNEDPVIPSWDPSWTKTKLLEFALSLGLDVSSTSTKTEIVNALTSAAQK